MKKMKRTLAVLLAAAMAVSLAACGGSSSSGSAETTAAAAADTAQEQSSDASAGESKDYSDYTIRIYSNSNSIERVTWLRNEAEKAGFSISIDDNTVVNGDTEAIQQANENKDGDVMFGLNETRWGQLVNDEYENLRIMDWNPSWADDVGEYKYPGKAYGLVIQNVLLLYRTDEIGTNGVKLHFQHWADVVDSGYKWFRQGKIGGTTNTNINSALLYPFIDPDSIAGGVSVDGWKTLWKYCADGYYTGDDQGIMPLNRGEVQIGTYYVSALYGYIDSAADYSDNPLLGTLEPENWDLVDIDDGTYYIAEYLGILDREGRTDEETEAVKAFAEWFGSADVQAEWGYEFDSFPCNEEAAQELYPDGIPDVYAIPNFALSTIEGTDMTYAEYVAAHITDWTNIMTNLGFYWSDDSSASPEPDWESLDWATLIQSE